MMQIINAITEKPEWYKKVFNEKITAKWRREVTTGTGSPSLTAEMVDWIFEELKHKSVIFQETGMISAFDGDVQLRCVLKNAVRPLEEVPEDEKDYHPSSDNKVVDLVHPSLYPLVYGRTRVLRDTTTNLEDFMKYPGKGETLQSPAKEEAKKGLFSCRFQWLPCDVEFDQTNNGDCHIVSYINNLCPDKHRSLYGIMQQIITRTIPIWNATLTPLLNNLYMRNNRIDYTFVDCSRGNTSEPTKKRVINSNGSSEKDDDDDDYYNWLAAWEHSGPVRPPPIKSFRPLITETDGKLDLQAAFADKGLQVIVKLANIELTPEKPDYTGGTWHVEGQLNEHICATAIYYYSNENTTTNTLCFRQRQNHFEWLEPVFGCVDWYSDTQITQDLGSVSCHQGRLLTFPNILQHCVSPFQLADPTKPGHRKILALFLIDPHIRVNSTANVPPQRADWYEEATNFRSGVLGARLPVELQDVVIENSDDFPISMEEANDFRLKLMEERSVASRSQDKLFSVGDFCLCEH
ncbi:hypothetical protein N7493_000719 [Penicillium malachiteum]|uniref:Uncharacterized protein n=1 Tax=Penicillium malachiteum TaxID=1324776 RepID=A0AAD6N192_9EURO|nr:hypothetical protein N7493_000719 [Penicillium malachiteum]